MPDSAIRRVLLIAFHYPPVQGSSGVQRILSLSKYLPDNGWQPTVLTVRPSAYLRVNSENNALIPVGVRVVRSWAFDAQKQFSILGRYPQILALPDRWRSWVWFGTRQGVQIVKKERPDVIVSSFPLATAHMIANRIHERTGVPWVADFRDPMVLANHPPAGRIRDSFRDIEESTFNAASRVVVTTPGAAREYEQRYALSGTQKICVVENGFDEELFSATKQSTVRKRSEKPIRILHSGLVYEEARNPVPLFRAASQLIASGMLGPKEVEFVFRASGRDEFVLNAAREFGLQSIVSTAPPISYIEALSEMMNCESLLILQSAACNSQIPAKAYEYLRCQRPILALTDPSGDTGTLLRERGIADLVALEDENQIPAVLMQHIRNIREGSFVPAPIKEIKKMSRQSRASEFGKLLNEVVNDREL